MVQMAGATGIEPVNTRLTVAAITTLVTRQNKCGAVLGIRTRTFCVEDRHARPLNTSTAQNFGTGLLKNVPVNWFSGLDLEPWLFFFPGMEPGVHALSNRLSYLILARVYYRAATRRSLDSGNG
jgi:hypothetical protein